MRQFVGYVHTRRTALTMGLMKGGNCLGFMRTLNSRLLEKPHEGYSVRNWPGKAAPPPSE